MEQIFKLQPDRCLALRGFDTFAASAALHSATPNSFQVSGTFRDAADFAVLMLWDADNFYEHPSTKYLPDFNFAGLVLNFNVEYSDGVQPIDSPKFNWIDWATLDCVLANGDTAQVRLWDYATLASGSFTPASGTFQLTGGANGPQSGEQLTLWFENMAFVYTVPNIVQSAEFAFYAAGTGTVHSITVAGRIYSHTETNPAGESSADQANALIALINAGSGDPDVVASVGSTSNAVKLVPVATPADATIPVSATDGNASVTLGSVSLTGVATALALSINTAAWWSSGGGQAVIANSTSSSINIQTARYGYANTSGAIVTWSQGPGVTNTQGNTVYPWSEKFPGLNPGDPFWINQVEYTVESVDSTTQVTLTAAPPSTQNGEYLAPRGGRDGNMFTLYATAQAATGETAPSLNTTQPSLQLAGGNSAVTWNVTIDFTARGIDQLRQCWLTFAPSLTNGAANTATNWLATFTNWTVTGDNSVSLLKVAGPGSVRIEEYSSSCTFTGKGWSAPPGETGDYSKYAAMAAYNATAQLDSSGKQLTDSKGNLLWSPVNNSLTVTYQSPSAHNLYVGTALYIDRGTVGVLLDGTAQPDLNCYLNTGSEVVTRRLLTSSVPAGSHTVTLTLQTSTDATVAPQYFYFDFLEAAILSDFQPLTKTFQHISPALDYDTDHTYKLSPARLMWIFDQLGFAGPVNEYMGVFWWNQRSATGAVFPQTTVTFSGTFAYGDSIFLTFDGSSTIGKTVFGADTTATIASHFAYYINASSTAAWAAASGAVLTITSRSPAPAYQLAVTSSTTLEGGSTGVVTVGPTPATGVLQTWVIDPTIQPVLNQSISDWHADFYAECFKRKLDVTTAGSMELVLPPSGFAAIFPDPNQTPVATATGFGTLTSTQCAVGASQVIAYQKQFYEAIAALQTAAGLSPAVQYGEFLWWYFPGPDSSSTSGMAYYDAETTAAAQTQLGRALYIFKTPNDDPTVNNSADATFLRNRLRDHVAALASDMKSNYPNSKVEVLFPYDVNYPQPITPGNQLGGQLNYFVNLPVEWKTQPTSGLDRMKVEALQFATQFRNLDLSTQAVALMPNFGWPRNLVRYLVPVFGTFVPWTTEVGLAFAQNLNAANLWAFDHICLFNLDLSNLREP